MKKKSKQIYLSGLVWGTIAVLVITSAMGNNIGSDEVSDTRCQPCSEYGLGYIPPINTTVTPRTLPTPSSDLPSTFDWRSYNGGDWTTPIRDQGSCGSCWAFGALGALEAAINIEFNDPDIDMDLSEQYLVSCAPGEGCGGGWANQSFEWMHSNGGALPEACFPYEATDLPCDQKCENWQDFLLPLGDYWTAINASDEQIKQALIDTGPVVADMAVYDDLFGYRGGVYVHPRLPSETREDINHQPVIVGYNDDEGCWIIKNSWGDLWGEDTYGLTGNRGWLRIRYGDCFIGDAIHGVTSHLIMENDSGRPEVELSQPLEGWLYLFNSPLREVFFGRTKVVGSLSIIAEAHDIEIEGEEMTGMDYVEFFVDGISEFIDTDAPYEWTLERHLGIHEIKAVAFDKAGNPSEEVTVEICKLL